MHVGHIRSTVIGDALCRMLRFLGHQVISDNHIGDWGTQFGMILYGYKHFLRRGRPIGGAPVEELGPALSARCATDRRPRQRGRCRRRSAGATGIPSRSGRAGRNGQAARRRRGEPPAVAGVPALLPEDEIERIYRRLDVTFDHTLGESFYHDRLAPWSRNCSTAGIARDSDGAVCVFLEGHRDADDRAEAGRGVPLRHDRPGHDPLSHGDLAARRHPLRGRSSPGAALPAAFRRRPAAGLRQDVELQHVSFGTVLGDDGRPFKTRSGDTVGLEGLLDEAVARARGDRRRQRRRQARRAGAFGRPSGPRVAETVGIAALKYADLSQNRTSDYVFSYDKMLAMNGNTATYMQYAYARVRSIFAKGNVDVDAAAGLAARRSCWARRPSGPWPWNCSASPRPSTWPWPTIAPTSSRPICSTWPTAIRPSSSSAPCCGPKRDELRAQPAAAVRPDRPDDPEGAGTAGDQGGGEDVGNIFFRLNHFPGAEIALYGPRPLPVRWAAAQ